jgi:hypothetical protein
MSAEYDLLEMYRDMHYKKDDWAIIYWLKHELGMKRSKPKGQYPHKMHPE